MMRVMGLGALAVMLASCGGDDPAAGEARAATSPAATAQDASGQKRFRDWLVSCDNVGTCYAFGPTSEGTGWVRIAMEAGPSAIPSVAVGFWPESGEFGGPVTARVDGRVFEARTLTGDDAPMAAVVDSALAPALVDAMAQGTVMTLNAGSQAVAVSLTGAAASLIWIDEQQGRLRTTTALIRKGSRPSSAVPAAPAVPHAVPAPAMTQAGYGDQEGQVLPAAVAALPAVAECRAETAFNPSLQSQISSARLSEDTVLWAVPCGLGAYNFANAYFTTTSNGENPRRLTFPNTRGESSDLLVNSAYDPAARTIDAFNKGRGLGDCGQMETWTWTTQGFVLSAAFEMSECWGVPQAYWPASWVSR